MTIKAFFLPLFLTISVLAAPSIQFRYERDLIEMYKYPRSFSRHEKNLMAECVTRWITDIAQEMANNKRQLSKEDHEYLYRLSMMACDILN